MTDEILIPEPQEELMLINIVEELVTNEVLHGMKNMPMCTCKRCQYDAAVIALNALPPRYVTTTKGNLLAEIGYVNQTFQFEVMVQVAKALKAVQESPSHT